MDEGGNIFYLNTPLKQYKYLKGRFCDLPEDVIKHYELTSKATPEGFVYVQVHNGLYGLLQVGLLAQELLEKLLNAKGCRNQNTHLDFECMKLEQSNSS